MIGVLIISGLIILIIGIIYLFKDEYGLAFFLAIVGSYILSGGILMYQESLKPTAMDVYKNKTTLEITYKDDIPIDSVVVFKEE